jgi:hypothetical protein
MPLSISQLCRFTIYMANSLLRMRVTWGGIDVALESMKELTLAVCILTEYTKTSSYSSSLEIPRVFGELLPPLQMPVVDLSVNRLFAAAPVASILQKIRDAGLHATKHMCSWLYPSPWLMSVLRLLDRSYSSKA